MSLVFHDRFLGKTSSGCPDRPTILGRWIISRNKDEPVFLNSSSADDGDFLIPDSSRNWRVLTDSDSQMEGSFRRSQLIKEEEKESLLSIGAELEFLIDEKGTWLHWQEEETIEPKINEKLDERPLEQKLAKLFKHLRRVCRRPRAHLQEEIERVLIHKARRLPTKAVSFLASHTEDWECRHLIRGNITPKRILSEVRDDQIDIYENRVCARLVDNLNIYLTKRIREIKKVVGVFKATVDHRWTHFLQDRIYELWGEAVNNEAQLKRARGILKKLGDLHYKLKGLMRSDLYKKIPRMVKVQPNLKMTNIFANDRHYRRVAELWQAYVRSPSSEKVSLKEMYLEAQRTCHCMDSFLMLLVVRAFKQLGVKPEDSNSPIRKSGRWDLKKNGVPVNCSWTDSGVIEITANDQTLSLVSAPMNFSQAENDEQVSEILEQLENCSKSLEGNLLVAYCSSDEPNKELSTELLRGLNTVGNDRRSKLPPSVGIVPVSPWDILSVERIARSLKWFLDKQRYGEYPRTVPVKKNQLTLLDSSSTPKGIKLSSDRCNFVLERPLENNEWAQWLSAWVNKADEGLARAQAKVRRLDTKIAKKEEEDCKTVKEHLEKLVAKLEKDYEWTKALLTCPTCSKNTDPFRLEPRTNGFHCSCKGCHTIWESRTCGNPECHQKFSVILPKLLKESISLEEADKFFGSDLLALPFRNEKSEWDFLCPHCGHIG